MCLRVFVFLCCAIVAFGTATAQEYYDEWRDGPLYDRAPTDEVMRLPKYCWGQYNPKLKGPQFRIDSKSCGVWTNHFCQALLMFNRSQNLMASATQRRNYLHGATGNLEYTMKGIKDYPSCYIRKHVAIMLKRARMAKMMMMP